MTLPEPGYAIPYYDGATDSWLESTSEGANNVTAFINPGSRIGPQADGWTNTFEGAKTEAERWLRRLHEEGMRGVELVNWSDQEDEGRWRFEFEHDVTKTRVTLETPGIDNYDAYCKKYIFTPKVYWNGSSSGSPEIEDFLAPGFRVVRTFEPEPT